MKRYVAVFFLLLSITAPALAKEKYQHAGPIHLDRDGGKWAEKTLRKLSLEEKVGQLFMVWVRAEFLNVNSPEYLQLRDTMRKYHVGSFAMTVRWEPPFLYRNQPYEAAELLNRLQQDSKLPLLFAADFERGVTMRLHGATTFPHAMAFGAAGKAHYAEAFGRITAQESRAIGVHWNFFPDADVNSNPANPIINTRSFGEDPQQVGDLVAAYVKGSRANGMMTTAKHFPGHGDTATDSHLSLAQVTGDRARLDSVELAPFRKAIAAGVDSVMVAHVTVPALEPDPNRVATTSPASPTCSNASSASRELWSPTPSIWPASPVFILPTSAAPRLRPSKPGATCCSSPPIWRRHTMPFSKPLAAERFPQPGWTPRSSSC
jgi:beta-N-acetylhexosaminidase